jgi:PAB1-binding protein PBP1
MNIRKNNRRTLDEQHNKGGNIPSDAPDILMVGLGRGGAMRRSVPFIIPISSCPQGTILAPTPARLPTAGSVAHGH